MSPKEQYEQLIRGTAKVLSEKELLTKLEKGQPLRAKLGVDRQLRIFIWAIPLFWKS